MDIFNNQSVLDASPKTILKPQGGLVIFWFYFSGGGGKEVQ